MPVAFHASGGLTPGNNRFGTFLEVHLHSPVSARMALVTSVLLGGVLERFPDLTVGFMEAGCGWVPFWLDHIDEEWEKRRAEAPLRERTDLSDDLKANLLGENARRLDRLPGESRRTGAGAGSELG